MSHYAFFSKDLGHWGKFDQSPWGCHDICLLLEQFHITHVTQLELTSLTHLKAWGDPQRFCSDVAFLLVLPKEEAVGERVYGLTMVWVYPYQARVSTIDDMARQLTQLSSTGPNWPNSLVQLNGDVCQILAMSLAERSANWRFTNFWAQTPEWFTQKDSMGVKFQ